jgi:hypothetical protein
MLQKFVKNRPIIGDMNAFCKTHTNFTYRDKINLLINVSHFTPYFILESIASVCIWNKDVYQKYNPYKIKYDCVPLWSIVFSSNVGGFSILHNIWVYSCRACEWTSLTKPLSTHKHIHTRMRRQFSDVNAVTNSTMRGYTMANSVWKMLFLPLENQLQFLTVSSL